jgi:anti-sigma B factor antagonist
MPATPRLQVEIFEEGTVATFVDQRIVDEIVIDAVGQQLLALVEQQKLVRLILNFSNVEFLSSAMLAKLFTVRRRIEKERGKLALCCVNPNVRTVFQFAPKGTFELFDEEQDALDAM